MRRLSRPLFALALASQFVSCGQQTGPQSSQVSSSPVAISGSMLGHKVTHVQDGKAVTIETSVSPTQPGTNNDLMGKKTEVAVRAYDQDGSLIGTLVEGNLPVGWSVDPMATGAQPSAPTITKTKAAKIGNDIASDGSSQLSSDEVNAIKNLLSGVGAERSASASPVKTFGLAGQWRQVAEVWYQCLPLCVGHHSATRIFQQYDSGSGFVTQATTTWCNHGSCGGSADMTFLEACTSLTTQSSQAALTPSTECQTNYDLLSRPGGHNCHDDVFLQVARAMNNSAYGGSVGDCNNGDQYGYIDQVTCAMFSNRALNLPWPSSDDNIALSKPGVQSSTFQGGTPAGYALDGTISTSFWAGQSTDWTPGTQQWWYVDLQDYINIQEIRIWNRGDGGVPERLNGARIYFSNDGTNWGNPVYTIGTAVLMPNPTVVTIGGTARYVKVQTSAAGGGITMSEVKIKGTRDNNIARNKPSSQSSTFQGIYAASRANDGNLDNNGISSANSTDYESMPWWKVDLEGSQPISKIEIHNRTDCCGDRIVGAKVYTSTDNVTFTERATLSTNQALYTINLSNVTARYVKVQLQSTNYLHMREVKVFPVQ